MSSETPTNSKAAPAGDADLDFELPPPAKVSGGKGTLIVAGVLLVMAIAFAAGLLPRLTARRALETEATSTAQSIPRVEVLKAKVITSDRDLVLPGSIEALEQTVIYARSQGYVKKWLVDIGDKVTEGQLLAEIDTPELDAQLEQARAQSAQAEADVVRAKANHNFSQANYERYQKLAPAGVASQQDLDRQQAQAGVDDANVTVAQATVTAQQANVRRLQMLKSFSRVTAPFAGTIIAREAERGALVNAGSTPLFKLAAIDSVRVMIQVPQDVAPSVRVSVPAKVTVREFAGVPFAGTVARSAGALDEVSRTMNVEVRVPNPDGKLLTGMYAQVALTLPTPHRLFEIPVTALYSDARGTRVATVGDDGRVTMKPIGVERDTGQSLQISTGLDGTERIVKLANAELTDGSKVEILESKPQQPPQPEKK
jgi:RND family efflux transporter MFP subunit